MSACHCGRSCAGCGNGPSCDRGRGSDHGNRSSRYSRAPNEVVSDSWTWPRGKRGLFFVLSARLNLLLLLCWTLLGRLSMERRDTFQCLGLFKESHSVLLQGLSCL